MNFIFVDRVISLEKDRSIRAVKQISLSEEYFSWHFPGRPVMPASLMIESAAQAATILLETSCMFSMKAFVAFVSDAKFRDFVTPGRELEIHLEASRQAGDAALLQGDLRQGERRCATVKIGMGLAPFGEIIPEENRVAYRRAFQNWLADSELTGFDSDPLEGI